MNSSIQNYATGSAVQLPRMLNIFGPALSALLRQLKRAGVVRISWWIYGLSQLVFWAVALLACVADHAQVERALDEKVLLKSKGYSEYVRLSVAGVDRLLISSRESYLHGQRLLPQSALDSNLAGLKGLVFQVSIANENGVIVDSTLGVQTPPANIADRKHFQEFKGAAQDYIYISEPVIGRVSKRPSIQLVRPIASPDGAFKGVIVASIDPEQLRHYFTGLDALQDDGVVAIEGSDGIMRFRLSASGFSAGDRASTTRNVDVHDSLSGIYTHRSSIDDVNRRIAYYRVSDYPLTVRVGVGTEAYFSAFAKRWTVLFGLLLVLSTVLLGVAWLVARLGKEQQNLISQLGESQAAAMEANKLKSNFLASVSHELRTPLNSILGFSELIRFASADVEIYKYANLIHTSGTHLHALVNTILDLAKIEAGKMDTNAEQINLRDLLGALTDIHRVSADKKKIVLSLSMATDFKGLMESDRTKLVQVFNNVLHNAIKFTNSGAIFVVAGTESDGSILVSVIDTGIGIPANKIGRVFERFNTVQDSGFQPAEKGTGLGLALCKELLTLIGGRIEISSEFGSGTKVDIFLPVKITSR